MLHKTLKLKERSPESVIRFTFQRIHRLYTATKADVAIERQGSQTMQRKRGHDTPLSQTNVSLSLSLIQKQCEELLNLDETELHLEDEEELTASGKYSCNPYDTAG